jgi:putative AlgH/UPF0301 family transcriptional regulator
MRNVLFSVRKARFVTGDQLGTSALWRPSTMNSLKGHLLIATPDLLDPNFARTVMLILEHNENGAMGLVLNRLVS